MLFLKHAALALINQNKLSLQRVQKVTKKVDFDLFLMILTSKSTWSPSTNQMHTILLSETSSAHKYHPEGIVSLDLVKFNFSCIWSQPSTLRPLQSVTAKDMIDDFFANFIFTVQLSAFFEVVWHTFCQNGNLSICHFWRAPKLTLIFKFYYYSMLYEAAVTNHTHTLKPSHFAHPHYLHWKTLFKCCIVDLLSTSVCDSYSSSNQSIAGQSANDINSSQQHT